MGRRFIVVSKMLVFALELTLSAEVAAFYVARRGAGKGIR
jgi:hypothetical protein